MAVKTTTTVKKAATPARGAAAKTAEAKKTAPTGKTASLRKSVKGQNLECSVCGLVITIDEDCGCAEEHVILCCDKPMRARRKTAARAKKTAAK